MLKEHKTAIFFSFLVGLIFSLNNLLLFLTPKPGFVFTPFAGGDENLYASQIQQFFSKGFYGDPFIWENKDKIPLLPFFPSLVLGIMAKFSGSMERLFIIGDFIFRAICWMFFEKCKSSQCGSEKWKRCYCCLQAIQPDLET